VSEPQKRYSTTTAYYREKKRVPYFSLTHLGGGKRGKKGGTSFHCANWDSVLLILLLHGVSPRKEEEKGEMGGKEERVVCFGTEDGVGEKEEKKEGGRKQPHRTKDSSSF